MDNETLKGKNTFDGELIWEKQTVKVELTFQISDKLEAECGSFKLTPPDGQKLYHYMIQSIYKDIDPIRFESTPDGLLCFSASLFLSCQPKTESFEFTPYLVEYSYKTRTERDNDFIRLSFDSRTNWPSRVMIPLEIQGASSAFIQNTYREDDRSKPDRVFVSIEKDQNSNMSEENLIQAAEECIAFFGYANGDFHQIISQQILSDGVYSFKSNNLTETTRALIPHRVIKPQDLKNFMNVASKGLGLNPNLDYLYLLHWYSSPKLHQENSFLNIFTMFEYLINTLLSDSETYSMKKKRFEKLSSAIKATIRDNIEDTETQDLVIEKIPELRRKSLTSNLESAQKKGFVSLAGINPEDLKAIRSIRNDLVHGGDKALDPVKLETAARLKPIIYELVNRLILRSIGWQGTHLSYVDGRNEVEFKTEDSDQKPSLAPKAAPE